MSFQLPTFASADFSQSFFASAPDVRINEVKKDGVAPIGFLITSILPEYFKVKGKWVLPTQTSIECTAVIRDNNTVEIVEFRNLKIGDKVVLGKSKDGSEGIYKHSSGFDNLPTVRSGRSVESSFSRDYEDLYELLEYEKGNNGYVV